MKVKLAQFDKHASMVLLCFMMDLLLLADDKKKWHVETSDVARLWARQPHVALCSTLSAVTQTNGTQDCVCCVIKSLCVDVEPSNRGWQMNECDTQSSKTETIAQHTSRRQQQHATR